MVATTGFPRFNVDGLYNFAPVWRGDWLEAAGFEPGQVPLTLEEFETAFQFFRHGDPDGDGVANTFALSNTGMMPIFGAFGALPDVWVQDENGDLMYGAIYPGMRDALELLARWYSEGLIDPEWVTGENQGNNWAWSIPFEQGSLGFTSSGAFYHFNPSMYWPDTGEMALNWGRTIRYATWDLDDMLIGYNPVGPDGHQGNVLWGVTGGDSIVFGHHLAEEPYRLSRIMEVFDAINSDYDTWIRMRLWDANMDENFEYIPGFGYRVLDESTRPERTHVNKFNSLQNPFFVASFRPFLYDWADEMPMFRTGGYVNQLPVVPASMPRYWASLEAFRETTYMQIIRGEHPIEFFDTFVEQWLNMGGATIKAEANEWHHAR